MLDLRYSISSSYSVAGRAKAKRPTRDLAGRRALRGIQGVVKTFVIFLARIVGHFVDRVVLKNERGHGLGYWVASIVVQILLGMLASIIVTWFSRRREFRADEGGARYAGSENMIAALEALKDGTAELPDTLAALGIGGGRMAALFSTHPPLETRIAALRALQS